MATVQLKNIKKIYPFVSGEQKKQKKKKADEPEKKKVNLQITDEGVVAVQEFNLDIADKEFIVLVGPSGCGKSTTLRMVAGLEDISDGELYIDGKLVNDVELLDGAGYEFDIEKVRNGQLSPVFFGSALTNFGVEPFLKSFLALTMSPLPRRAEEGVVDPFEDNFSAFVFKIQANMNKAHRDRVAFMRITSGKFTRDMEVYHVQGNKKQRLSQPQALMAQDREILEEAYAGDIIGVFDPGMFSIGDTLCAPGKRFVFDPIPTFAPEIFAAVERIDTMKRKQFEKGMTEIAQEGAIQIFQELGSGMEEIIVGVVGILQFAQQARKVQEQGGKETDQ